MAAVLHCCICPLFLIFINMPVHCEQNGKNFKAVKSVGSNSDLNYFCRKGVSLNMGWHVI